MPEMLQSNQPQGREAFFNSLRPDDIFVVTFPKSGTNWISFFLACAVRKKHPERFPEPLNISSYRRVVPDVNNECFNGLPLGSRQDLPSPRIFSAHALFDERFPRVIYAVRDPRDVALSYYYHQRRGTGGFNMTLDEYVSKNDMYPSDWGVHVNGWIRNARGNEYLFVKYENLHQNPEYWFSRILDFVGIDVSKDEFAALLEESSFGNMRSLEEQYGVAGANNDPSIYFMRQGITGGWSKEMPEQTADMIVSRYEPIMRELGYETAGTSPAAENGRCWCGGSLINSPHESYGICKRCGTQVNLASHTADDLRRFYGFDRYWHEQQKNVSGYPVIEERAALDLNDRIPVWLDLLRRFKSPSSLLEIGCAHGGFLHYAHEHGIQAVVGIEPDERTCAFARSQFRLPFVVSGLFPDVELPFTKYDAVVGFDVLEHFTDPVRALETVASMLEVNGVCLFQTPSYRGEGREWEQYRKEEHLFLFGNISIRELFHFAGLEIVEILPGLFRDDMFIIGRRIGKSRPTRSGKRIRIAGQEESQRDLTAVQDYSDFANRLRELMRRERPSKIIETGTYFGEGATRFIAEALRDFGMTDATFYSVEYNPSNHEIARNNLSRLGLLPYVDLVNGLSVPRAILPTLDQIRSETVTNIEYNDIFIDHSEEERASLYYQETNFESVPANMLGRLLRSFDYKPDLVLLDSGGHMGYVEFSYLISKLRGPCYIALDDVYHIKHHKSLLFMQNDPRFEIINLSHEKFGFCIAKFTPAAGETRERTENILWVRTDSIGDAVLASSMLPYIKKKYHNGKITAVCQRHIAELYEASPFVDEVIPLDKNGFASDNEYASWFLEQISGLDVDVAINSVFSRDAVSDRITLAAQADEYVALYGDSVNISAHDWEDANRYYTSLIPHCAGHRTEIQRHSDFLDALGIEHEELQPIIWTAEEDKAFADDFFRENGIRPEKTIVLFAGAQSELRRYEKYGEALSQICDEGDYTVIALGSSPDGEINSLNLKDIKTATYDLSGKTTIRQSAEIIRRSCLAVGAETGLAHIACAVGTRNVILLGGGQFGRFMPYSSPTSIVSLPLECYGCNWSCRFIRSHCVQDVNTGVFATAIREALRNTSEKPRVYVQGLEYWKPKPSEPERIRLDNFLDLESVDLIEVRFEASIKKNMGDNSDGQMNISDDGEIDPTSYEDVLNEMNRLEQSGKSDMGLRVLNLFIEKHGASTKLLNLLAEYKIKNNDKEAAREILNKILASEPGNVDALNNLSVVDILEEKWISAARNLELVLSIDVDNETAIANLGYLKAVLTAQKEALEVERAAVTERNVMAFQNTMDGANDAYPLTEQLSYSPGLPEGAKKRTNLQSVFSPEEFPRGSRNSSEMSGADEDSRLDEIVNRIVSLPHDWHLAGSVGPNVIRAMANCLKGRRVYHSVETGSGKTTLLFSHASQDHKVFSVDAGKSITNVRNSFLFDPRRVEFIEGPTQKTLPLYKFQHKLQIAFIDGPHAYPFPQLEYYYIYPHLEKDSLLIIDDINIPTIKQLFDFLREDEMFSLLEVVDNTAFLERTEAQTFSQFGDGWETQNYNKRHLSQ